jgi:membrane protease YdiL (CAAX protease family)
MENRAAFLIGLFLRVGGFFLLAQGISSTALLALSGIPAAEFSMETLMALPNAASLILQAQIWGSGIGFIVLPLLSLRFLNPQDTALFKWVPNFPLWTFPLALATLLFSAPLISLIYVWNHQLHLPAFMSEAEQWMRNSEAEMASLTRLLGEVQGPMEWIPAILVMAIIPAFGEELVFRGILQRQLQKVSSIHLAVWLSAFLFSAIHFQFLGFFPRMLLGVMFGYVFAYTGNFWLPVSMHFANNLSSLIVYNIQGWEENTSPEVPDLVELIPFTVLLMACIALWRLGIRKNNSIFTPHEK